MSHLDEIAVLKAALAERDASLAERDSALSLAQEQLLAVQRAVQRLKRENERLKQQAMGTRRERIPDPPEQTALWFSTRGPGGSAAAKDKAPSQGARPSQASRGPARGHFGQHRRP